MKRRIDRLEGSLFIIYHLSCLLVIWVGVSRSALIACLAMYIVRIFGITAGYHRYFSHRTFKTTRLFQFVLAWLGACAVQRGPLWWAAHHRYHHKYSDTEQDRHSPITQGFWWSHVGWFLSPDNLETDYGMVPDLDKNRELLFIDNYYWLPPASLAISLWILGRLLEHNSSSLATTGWQLFVWGFVVSTVLLYHGTFTVNSLCHKFGRRRFNTNDDSRNNVLIALITFGEGWHNNHHFYPASERQGFYRWEIDISHCVLLVLCHLGIVWDLQSPPERVYEAAPISREAPASSR
jgi:stearoyl-CoA desaturase (Delta-9 desaturase)